MLSLDDRDPSVLDAVVAAVPAAGASRVVVAHVFNEDPLPSPLADLLEPEDHTLPPELELAVEELARRLPGVEVRADHATGTVEAEIARLVEAHGADLVVLGRNPAEGDKPGWGSSGSKLIRLAPCSVLVVPRGSRLDTSRAVAGLDFSKGGIRALSVAARLCGSVRAVYHFEIPRSRRAGLTMEQWTAKVLASAQAHLEQDVRPSLPDGVTPELGVVGTGKVGEALIEQAGEGLLVVGSRGSTTLAWALLGSSANRVSARARGPVLVVREVGRPAEGVLERLVRR
ncbi:universal stress protein [Myxococcota bacterium]|nr:universal stress protein [Myxococcota bacterium]